ncbi:MAG: protease inhibitor I42 family protein [Treponema sp.]|jgi:predicted secreted protein|nr:protease inhibitor I42 family protein [Treponema sp.]
MYKKINSLFLVLIFLVNIGCKTVKEEPTPEPAPAHRTFVIFKTTGNPTTGYDWEIWIDYDSTGRFALNNLQREEIYPGAIGSPQRQTYTLRSSQPGRVFVHFIYKRPWEGGGELGRYIFTFDIDQDLKISLLDTQRTVTRGFTEDSLPVIEVPEIRN